MTPATLLPPDPPLTDGDIVLRPWVAEDVDQITDACQDERIQRFIPIPRPYRTADAVDYVARTAREWDDGTTAAFAIVDADTPEHVLGAINLALAGSVGNSGYWVAPAARERRVATRALGLLTRWAFEELGVGVILLEIKPENAASQAVAAVNGYHHAGRLEVAVPGGTKGGMLFSRLATD